MESEQDVVREIKHAVIRLLARREYCHYELTQRLEKKYDADLVEQVLAQLEEDGYVSEQRFIESYVRNKLSQGYGYQRIRFDMQQKRVDQTKLEAVLEELAPDWFELASEAYQRRFRQRPNGDYKLFGKQMRFLLQRGFSMDEARAAIDGADDLYE